MAPGFDFLLFGSVISSFDMSDVYYFLPEDRAALERDIAAIGEEIRNVQGDTAESTEQTSETWHDNFMFEDGQRQMNILAHRLATLNGILGKAVVVEPRRDGVVGVGNRVDVRDELTGEERWFTIGSFMGAKQGIDRISYASPLGQLLFGAKVGDVRKGTIGSAVRTFTILSIE
jgi:transcription elongation GreA/GreB family factor